MNQPDTGKVMAPGRLANFLTPERRRTVISILVVMIVWELMARYVIQSDLIFASLTDIALNFYEMGRSGELWKHVRISALEFVLGYSTAAILGILLGILLALHRSSAQYIEPWLGALYATPMIALAPIFIVLLGIGIYSNDHHYLYRGLLPDHD